MIDDPHDMSAPNYLLEPGYIFIATRPTVISTVLGSCVSVCLYDRKRKVGGMNHFLYPQSNKDEEATAQFGNAATLELIRMMLADGSKIKHLEAQVLGGARNIDISPTDIGRKNITAARKMLKKQGVRIVSEDVGGTKGRKVVFHSNINELVIIKVDRLRKSDWYPYEGSR